MPEARQVDAETFLTVPEVCAYLRVSKMTVYRLIHADELASVRVGRGLRVPRSALRRFIGQGGNDLDSPAVGPKQ